MDTENLKPTTVPALSDAAIAALYQGNKIEAIKIIREERKIGLKEAKDAVDDYVRSQPVLQSSLASAQAQTKRSVLVWAAALIAAGLLLYQILVKP